MNTCSNIHIDELRKLHPDLSNQNAATILKSPESKRSLPAGKSITIFTDGSRKSVKNDHDRSFGGWGFALMQTDLNSHNIDRNEPSLFFRFGGLDNTTPIEAELRAILQGLQSIDRPSYINIITDSKQAIESLAYPHSTLLQAEQLKRGSTNLTDYEVTIAKQARLLTDIHTLLESNPDILAARINWCRSHVLEGVNAQRVITDHTSPIEDKIAAFHINGNQRADYIAQKGENMSIYRVLTRALNHLGAFNELRDLSYREAINAQKSFAKSETSRNTAVYYIATNGWHNHKELEKVLPKEVVQRGFDAYCAYREQDYDKFDRIVRERFTDEAEDNYNRSIPANRNLLRDIDVQKGQDAFIDLMHQTQQKRPLAEADNTSIRSVIEMISCR